MSFVLTALLVAQLQAALPTAAAASLPANLSANQAAAPVAAISTPYALPPLPYAFNALEPAVDTETMTVHHGKHHAAFINNLNQLSAEVPALRSGAVESLLAEISKHPAAVRNNLGGHFNHAMFWKVMAPVGKGGAPSKALQQAITQQFGSMDAFKTQFADAGAKRFGSGWAWLIVQADGKLAVTSTANQDNPLMDLAELRGTPVLALDVWEHAYYLKYRNLRGDYIKAWWTVVNWNEVNTRFEQARAKSK